MRRKGIYIIFFIFVALSALYIVDKSTSFFVSEKVTNILSPVGIVMSNFGSKAGGLFYDVKNISNLQNENKNLEKELNIAQSEIAKLNDAKNENEALRNDLNFKKTNSYNLVAANIISFDPNNLRDTILINRGSNDGLKDGDVVVCEGFLVGKLNSVTSNDSKIQLITDPGNAIPATLVGRNLQGIVYGEIGNGLILEQIPQTETVNVGDLVATSGLGGSYPKSLVIGKVESIEKISGSIFQSLKLRSSVSFDRLENVMVIVN
jgi:rod shape-determining protein MreC